MQIAGVEKGTGSFSDVPWCSDVGLVNSASACLVMVNPRRIHDSRLLRYHRQLRGIAIRPL